MGGAVVTIHRNILFIAALILPPLTANAAPPEIRWQKSLQAGLNELDAEYPGQLGIFVHDLRSGESFNFRGDENWYYASGIKLIVAAEVLRQIEEGKLALDTQIKVGPDDFIDGAGEMNFTQAGSSHTVKHLLEQMMIHSDNTASDLLIRKAGLDNVNALAKKHHLGRVTLLADVRRKVYGQVHPAALKLKNKDLMELSRAPTDRERALLLERLIQVPAAEWKKKTIESAFAGYYAEGFNTGSLKKYTVFLSKLSAGTVLKPESTKMLFEIMSRTKTGEKRIKSALDEDLSFAHKTGTQRKRLCDFGIVRRENSNLAVVSACARGFTTTAEAEKALGRLGGVLNESGIFSLAKDPTGESTNE